MFNTKKFGAYLSKLRKQADMTQSELADVLNLTRQSVSKYEVGESFPDVSILVLISDIFSISLDDLINSGEPTRGEAIILNNIANGNNDIKAKNADDIINLAPLLKPSVLSKISSNLADMGIDISNIVSLAEFLHDDEVRNLLKKTTFNSINSELLEKLIPFLDEKSKELIFRKILEGTIDWRMTKILLPYARHMRTQVEAAVVAGALPLEVL